MKRSKPKETRLGLTELLKTLDRFERDGNGWPAWRARLAQIKSIAIAAHEERKLNWSNGAKKPNEIECLRQEVRRLTDELEAIEANAIVALKERSAKGGRAA